MRHDSARYKFIDTGIVRSAEVIKPTNCIVLPWSCIMQSGECKS